MNKNSEACLHYKTFWIRNLRKMYRFRSKLVSFYCQSLSLACTNTLAFYRILKLLVPNLFIVLVHKVRCLKAHLLVSPFSHYSCKFKKGIILSKRHSSMQNRPLKSDMQMSLNRRWPKRCLGWVFNSKLVSFASE